MRCAQTIRTERHTKHAYIGEPYSSTISQARMALNESLKESIAATIFICASFLDSSTLKFFVVKMPFLGDNLACHRLVFLESAVPAEVEHNRI